MPKVLDELRQDHKNMARLWDLLGRELKVFKEGGLPDYDLVESILDYCINYPDLFHHPREDLVFQRLKAVDPASGNIVGDLEQEHAQLGALTRRFSNALKNVLEDEQLPRDWFMDVANDFLNFARNHMQMEEVLFFPAADKHLTDDDWDQIEAASKKVGDPLFGEMINEKYQRLYDEILEWGKSGEEKAKAS
jgi:hemerythrin-like domain-containing protein